MRFPAGVFALVAATAASLVPGTSAQAQEGSLFGRLAGRWAGSGTVNVMNSLSEPVRCRADYAPSGGSRLRFGIVCASASFKIQVASDIARQGNRLTGGWHEATFNASGNVDGTVGANRISATVTGGNFRADLNLNLRGDVQTVSLVSQGQIAGSAVVTLRRE